MKFFNPRELLSKLMRARARKSFEKQLEVAAVEHSLDIEEYAVHLMESSIAAKKRGLDAVLVAAEYAEQLNATKPAQAKLVELFKDGLIEQALVLQRLTRCKHLTDSEVQASLDDPFDDASQPGTSFSSGLPRRKALEDGTARAEPGEEQAAIASPSETPNPPPPRRGRGRPRKYPKTTPGSHGTETSPSDEPQP